MTDIFNDGRKPEKPREQKVEHEWEKNPPEPLTHCIRCGMTYAYHIDNLQMHPCKESII